MLSPTVVSRIASNWREAAHEPHHPSYQLLAAECYNQFLSVDCTITPYSTGSPYQTLQEMFEDIDRNKHLHVFVCGSPLAPEHPLSQPTPDGTLNVWFRAIHDIHGHFETRSDFSLEGEVQAYLNHKAIFSPGAHAALFSETIGQLCYFVEYGTFVPEQKCAIIPVEF